MTTEIQEYSQTEAALIELRTRYANATYDVETADGMKAAKEARAEVRGYRTALENKRKEIKQPALDRCRLIDDEAKRITAELVALEDPIDRQIKTREARIEAEKQAKIEAEQKRVQAAQERIAEIRGAVAAVNSMGAPSSAKVAEFISDVEALSTDGMDEFEPHAKDAKTATLAILRDLHKAAVDREAEAERVKQERAELDKLRAEQAARDAAARAEREAADKAAREAREADERAERERLDAARKAQQEESARLTKEKAQVEAERRAIEQQKERDRQAAEKAERAARRAKFPGRDAIITALCEHFDVTGDVVEKWLAAL